MQKYVPLAAAALILAASPAQADDAAMDVESMMEQSETKIYQPITPDFGTFDISGLSANTDASFMATMSKQFEAGFRLNEPVANFDRDSSAGLAALIVPEEFAFRSNEQDSGVDSVNPGRYLSHSVRSDYLSDTGPAARDKSSVGVRFGF